MERYIFLFVFFLLVVIGCGKESSISSPVDEVDIGKLNWIELPQSENMVVETSFSSSEWISGYFGDNIYLNRSYHGGPFGKVTIDARASFPSNSFDGIKYITMTIDDRTCTATFSPSMVFDKPMVYNVTFTGVDLKNVNPASVKFAYLANDGTIEYASHEGITVSISTGTLKVKNAKISHFSRYGFVN